MPHEVEHVALESTNTVDGEDSARNHRDPPRTLGPTRLATHGRLLREAVTSSS